jgi:hypothetical protein
VRTVQPIHQKRQCMDGLEPTTDENDGPTQRCLDNPCCTTPEGVTIVCGGGGDAPKGPVQILFGSHVERVRCN